MSGCIQQLSDTAAPTTHTTLTALKLFLRSCSVLCLAHRLQAIPTSLQMHPTAKAAVTINITVAGDAIGGILPARAALLKGNSG